MKSPLHTRALSDAGFALVLVLGIMVLLVVLAVGFLVRATTERQAATGYHASVVTRELADTAVSIVQGQINMASNQGSKVAWVSQPGMVRTFDAGGSLLKAYKLYSAPDMVASSVGITAGKSPDEPPATWSDSPAIWIDLNAPVESNGAKNFPILDAASAAEGFAITSAPGATAYQPVPMPLRWLYVLRDGSLVAPAGSGNQATVAGESTANPIVGRVAFWTDDESCKVNINTASEGTFWDIPRADTNQERALGSYQPAQHEFQRYPGHPAMTSLSGILFPTLPLDQQKLDQIYSIVPRIIGGGSNAGTQLATTSLKPDSDRLYASVDELIFDPNRSGNAGLSKTQLEQAKFFLTSHSRAPETNLFNLPRIACWPVFKGLLSDRVTAFDKLIAFCASTGATGSLIPYYFQREKADSPTNDIGILRNTQLYSYLQYLTSQPVTGFGGNFLAKYGSDQDQILTEIFDYIRCTNLHDDMLVANKQFTTYWPSTSTTFPTGFGWVAPTVNSSASGTTMGFGRTLTLSELGIGFICNAAADNPATPLVDESNGSNTASGTGANAVLGGTALSPGEQYIQAILVPELFSPMLGFVGVCPNIKIEISGLETLQLTSPVAAQLFPVSSGVATYDSVTTNYDTTRIWGGNMGWRYSLYAKGSPAVGNLPGDSVGTALTEGAIKELYPFIGTPIKISSAGGTMAISEGSLTVKIYAKSVAPGNLLQTLHIKIPACTTLPIPKLVNCQVQKTGTTLTDPANWWSYSATGAVAGKSGRLFYNGKNAGGNGSPIPLANASSPGSGAFFLKDFDVVRTVLPKDGDYRLVAASNDVPDTVFLRHPLYDAGGMFASNLTGASTSGDPGYSGGKYITSLSYSSKWIPDIPSTASGTDTPQGTGDYDNAMAQAMDGPLVNKPDEGAVNRIAGRIPYFDNSGVDYVGGQTFFSPNRQIPSPAMLGSLSTGVKAGMPWRTLLFRPQANHFGATSPSDHLFLDLFWMPVVEPYAISDRFSTAGKINLNYQILPFTYIDRSTGIRALLKGEQLTAIPNTKAASYKSTTADVFRTGIDAAQTLGQFKAKFDTGNVFRSASEICDIHIVPTGQTAAAMSAFWTSNALTGDNTRERIYTTLYPRLTARSNTYTVHFRVQALRKVPGSTAGTWSEGRDQVTGEYRGSTTIERFINASNPKIPDYAADPSKIPTLDTLDKFYKWRTVENRQFAP